MSEGLIFVLGCFAGAMIQSLIFLYIYESEEDDDL